MDVAQGVEAQSQRGAFFDSKTNNFNAIKPQPILSVQQLTNPKVLSNLAFFFFQGIYCPQPLQQALIVTQIIKQAFQAQLFHWVLEKCLKLHLSHQCCYKAWIESHCDRLIY